MVQLLSSSLLVLAAATSAVAIPATATLPGLGGLSLSLPGLLSTPKIGSTSSPAVAASAVASAVAKVMADVSAIDANINLLTKATAAFNSGTGGLPISQFLAVQGSLNAGTADAITLPQPISASDAAALVQQLNSTLTADYALAASTLADAQAKVKATGIAAEQMVKANLALLAAETNALMANVISKIPSADVTVSAQAGAVANNLRAALQSAINVM